MTVMAITIPGMAPEMKQLFLKVGTQLYTQLQIKTTGNGENSMTCEDVGQSVCLFSMTEPINVQSLNSR